MKVILLQDVAKIGRRSEVVEVPDGYALNQLIPKLMAEPATPANMKRIERMQSKVEAGKVAGQERFELAGKALQEKTIKIAAESNEQGHLFKAVNEADITEAAGAEGIDFDSSMVVVGSPIKELGEHVVELMSGEDKVKFTIEIVKK